MPVAVAISHNVSPDFTVYLADDGDGAGALTVFVVARLSDCPAMIRSGLVRLLSPMSFSTVSPVVVAIAESVSPGWMRYVVAASRADANDCADAMAAITAATIAGSWRRQLRKGRNALRRDERAMRRRGRVRLCT